MKSLWKLGLVTIGIAITAVLTGILLAVAADDVEAEVLFDGLHAKTESVAFVDEAKAIHRAEEMEQLAGERKAEAERLEQERIAAEKAEAERLEQERIASEKAEAERLEQERIAAEKAEEQSGSTPVQDEVSASVPVSLSFGQAGHVRVNGGCSGFFISPTQVATANHCALANSQVELIATGEVWSATIAQSIPGKDYAVLTIQGSNPQASTLWQRQAVLGETVTVYSRNSGTFRATISEMIPGTVTSLGNGTMQLNYQDSSLGTNLTFIDAPSYNGDSGSIVLGQDGAMLGVIAGGDSATFAVFVS